MEAVKKSFKELTQIAVTAVNLTQSYPNTKLEYACQKFLRQYNDIQGKIREMQEDARIEHCSTDEKGTVLIEGDKYQYTKEGLKALNTAIRACDSMEFEVKPYFASELPEDISPITFEIIEGVIVAKNESGN